MKSKNFLLFCLIFLLPSAAFPDRFIDYDEPAGSGGIFNFILFIFIHLASYAFLLHSYVMWMDRRKNNEKPKKKDDVMDWVFTIIGYLIVSVFISFPILLIIKWFFSVSVMREYMYFVYIASFSLLTYLRRT